MGNLKRVLIKNLGVSRSCLMQLKAPDRSVDIAPPISFFFLSWANSIFSTRESSAF